MDPKEILKLIKERGLNDDLKKELIRELNTQNQTRSFDVEIKADQIDKENRTIKDLALSSEEPYERWFGFEILDHSPGAVRLDRLNNGAPFLANHDSEKHIGIIVKDSAKIGKDKILRISPRFSKSGYNKEALRIWDDTLDNIRTKTSVGYIIHELILEKQTDEGPDIYRVTDWEPLEGSSVSLAADDSMGVGRDRDIHQADKDLMDKLKKAKEGKLSKEEIEKIVEIKTNNLLNIRSKTQMDEKEKKELEEKAKKDRKQAVDDALAKREEEIDEITKLCKAHNIDVIEILKTRPSLAEARGLILDKVGDNVPLQQPMGGLDLSRNDAIKYNVWNFIRAAAENNPEICAFEKEVSNTIAKRVGKASRGYYVDYGALSRGRPYRREITVGAGSADKLVAVDLQDQDFIDLLHNEMVMGQLGVRFMPGLVGNVDFPKKSATSIAYWVGESGAASESDITFGNYTLSPKTISALVRYSRQTALQTTPAMHNIVLEDVINVIKLAVDLAIIAGTGADNQPTGIINTGGVGAGVSGTSFTFGKAVDMITEVRAANARGDGMAYLTNPTIAGTLQQREVVTNYPTFIIANGQMAGRRVLDTNQVPANHIIFGDFRQVRIGEWGILELQINPYNDDGGVKVIPFFSTDFGIDQPGGLTVVDDFS